MTPERMAELRGLADLTFDGYSEHKLPFAVRELLDELEDMDARFRLAMISRDAWKTVKERHETTLKQCRSLVDEWDRLASDNEIYRGKPTKVAGWYRRCANQLRNILDTQ